MTSSKPQLIRGYEVVIGLENHVADLTVVRVPDCGHFVTWKAPDAVNAAMDAFLG